MSKQSSCGCHAGETCEETGLRSIVMVGNPNVGKSALFNRLTGSYVTVSNYPGTTVEVSQGRCKIDGEEFFVEDTPGMYSLLPITEEERVSRDILLAGKADVVLCVVDAKNLKRMLSLALQLVEASLPVILVLNMMDEANRLDILIDEGKLEKKLGIPVVGISALSGKGVDILKKRILSYRHQEATAEVFYGDAVEGAVNALAPLMPAEVGLSQRALALLFIQNDPNISILVRSMEESSPDFLDSTLVELEKKLTDPVGYTVPMMQHSTAEDICSEAYNPPADREPSFAQRLSDWTMEPLTGIPILMIVLYYGLYKFVGGFGAGTIVGFLEEDIFGKYLSPWINNMLIAYVPWGPLRELIGMQYGIVTLGIRYAIAIMGDFD